MSEGKFSQPRPHRDEERQIEESFRQLTEDIHGRHKKVYAVEDDIGRTVQEISAEASSQPNDSFPPLERSVRLEQTAQAAPTPNTAKADSGALPHPGPVSRKPAYDLLPEDVDSFFEEPPKHQEAGIPEEDYPEEPDFIDKLLQFGTFFRKHQTPIILGLCGSALLLIILFVSIFFTGSEKDPYEDIIFPNVLIADINIGGMTKSEAVSVLKNATQNTYTQQDMVIDLSGTEIRLSPKHTGARMDVQAAVDAAYAYGRSGSKDQQEQAYQKALREEHILAALPFLQLDTDYIRRELNAYAEDTGSTLTQTSYGLEGSEPVLSADKFHATAPTQTLVIIMGTPGIGFDANQVYEKVLDAYSLHQFLVEVENVESVTSPDPIDLEAIYKEFYIAPVNASVNLQTFQTESGSYGYGFDLEAAQALVDKAQPGEVLRIPMEYIEPEILNHAAFFQDILGEHQTRGTGDDDRNRNLQMACDVLNGTVLNPSESLSFRSAMNKVAGFRTAPEDTGLEPVDQGGITQVASTLYYAALMSDLNISSRSNHTYLPSFIDYGLDATADLTILNSTGYPIRIDASFTGGYVKVQIVGTEERNYYVMLESSISNSTAPQTVYEEFPHDNEEGYLDGDVIEEGRNGYLVKSYKVKYDRKNGKELSRNFLANSQYPAADRIVASVAEPPTEAPTEAPTVPPTEAPAPPPTEAPVAPPVEAPTEAPTVPPTEAPTTPPTEAPTEAPTEVPTVAPTEAPVVETPAEVPTTVPTEAPVPETSDTDIPLEENASLEIAGIE